MKAAATKRKMRLETIMTALLTVPNGKDGKFGKALEFDGGQWVSIESTPELQVGEELTMMAWFFRHRHR